MTCDGIAHPLLTYMYKTIHWYTHEQRDTHRLTCTSTRIQAHSLSYTQTHILTFAHTHTYTHTHIHTHKIHTHTHTHTHTHKHMHKHMHKHTHRLVRVFCLRLCVRERGLSS